jgi:hypothetical protein
VVLCVLLLLLSVLRQRCLRQRKPAPLLIMQREQQARHGSRVQRHGCLQRLKHSLSVCVCVYVCVCVCVCVCVRFVGLPRHDTQFEW